MCPSVCIWQVLLKNEGGLLPLKRTDKLAFIGPHADSTQALLSVRLLQCFHCLSSCFRRVCVHFGRALKTGHAVHSTKEWRCR